MATALLRVGDAACNPSNVEAFRQSNLMRLMLSRTKEACRQSAAPHAACNDLLDDFKVSPCLQDRPRTACAPLYWTRDYATATPESANCWTPRLGQVAATPSASASPPQAVAPTDSVALPSPTVPVTSSPPSVVAAAPRGVCDGYTVYLQIYGPELRDQVTGYRDPWRELGATVPPVEDVVDSARRAARRVPQPYPVPTVIYYDTAALPCVGSLQPKGAWPAWKALSLPGGSAAQQRVIEVWVPPPSRTAEGSSDAWLQELLPEMNAGNATTRMAALDQMKKNYAASPAAVVATVTLLEAPRFDALSPAGRINVLTFLRNTQRGAWTPQQVARAEAAIASIRARGAPRLALGQQADEALTRLSGFLLALKS